MTYFDELYPEKLRHISRPPHVLYCRGSLDALRHEKALAIVGTRSPSQYGQEVARRAAQAAIRAELTVVSGLAIGIDTSALAAAAKLRRPAIAILANGLDRIYPAENEWLAHRLLEEGGCLLSENPPGTEARPDLLVERNRIQTGMSDGVFLVESNLRGGSMRTARFAILQGRPLSCLAHPQKWADHKAAQGPRKLIKDGKAIPISDRADLQDFLERFRPRPAELSIAADLSHPPDQATTDLCP
ncbi:DNA-protecting protein DprA [Amorphus sp. 3PC139-8]